MSAKVQCNRSVAHNAQAGFSLMEILVVITLIAVVTGSFIYSFTNIFNTKSEVFSRKLATIIRSSRDLALLKGKVVRLRIDMAKQQYWVEAGPPNTLLLTEEQEAELRDRLSPEELVKHEKQQGFRPAESITSDKLDVPNGVRISGVLSPRYKEKVTEGTVDTYFFTQGFSEASIIYLEDYQKTEQSLVINAITGKTTIKYGKYEPGAQR